LTSNRRSCTALLAASAAIAAGAIAPAAANAVTLQVTGDDGNPIALGGTINIRNMSPQVSPTGIVAGDVYSIAVAGPNGGQVAVPATCYEATDTPPSPRTVDYVGNGAYIATLTQYAASDRFCSGAPIRQTALPFSITASVAIAPPAAPALTRKPGSFSTNTVPLAIDLNPGALTHEIFVERNAQPNPDGSLPGTPDSLFADTATKTVGVPLNKGPGNYVVVARAKGYSGLTTPNVFTAFSAPVAVRTYAPFDLKSFRWTDSRGPSYRFHATIMETSATGKVNVAIGRGKKGKYKSLGTATIRKHAFSKRFRLSVGKWRIRFKYKGNATVAGGFEVHAFEITRRIVFRGATFRSSAVG
jgi:hypothetical protein